MVSHHPNQLSYDSPSSRQNSHHSHIMPMATVDRQHHHQEISYSSSTPRQTSHLAMPLAAHTALDRHLPHPELHLPSNATYLANDNPSSSHGASAPHLYQQHFPEPVYNQFFLSPSVPNAAQYAPYNQSHADYPLLPAPGYAPRSSATTGGSLSQYATMAGHELLPPFQPNVHHQLSPSAYSTPPLFSTPSMEATHMTESQYAHPSQFTQAYPLSRSASRDSAASASVYSHSLTPETESYGSVPSNHSDSQISAATTEIPQSTVAHHVQSHERPSASTQPRQPPYYGRLVTSPSASYPIAPSTFQPPRLKREYDEDEVSSSDDESVGPAKAKRVSPVPHRPSGKEIAPKRERGEPSATRVSARIRSMGRTSYADIENGETPSPAASFPGSLSSPPTDDEEDDFRPPKRTRAPSVRKKVAATNRRPSNTTVPQPALNERSLWALNHTYPDLQSCFPLFYHALNPDLSINMDAVPLIGTIPATVSPEQKADRLRAFWHRGRRILAQLDAFTKRCDRKYEGPSQRWPDLDESTRLAIRDVRRKAVERCENYKYTRRDILDKVFGKNNWDPIETGMVEWREGMANHDPALDLNGGKMDPEPQPGRPANESVITYRAVRPMPSRGRLVSSRNAHAPTAGGVQRKAIEGPAAQKQYEPSPSPSLPQYGEDEVPLTVQMPGISSPATARESPQRPSIVVGTSTWSQGSLWEESDTVVVPRPTIKCIGSDDSLSPDWAA